jgi:hypothetical protein
VRAHLVDYHFGRLSPEMNAAIEQHVRTCDQCRTEGLVRLATEKRVAARDGYKGRSNRSLRVVALLATLVLLALMLYLLLATGGHSRRSPLGLHVFPTLAVIAPIR